MSMLMPVGFQIPPAFGVQTASPNACLVTTTCMRVREEHVAPPRKIARCADEHTVVQIIKPPDNYASAKFIEVSELVRVESVGTKKFAVYFNASGLP